MFNNFFQKVMPILR